LPKELTKDGKIVLYVRKVEGDKGTLHLTRVLRSDLLMIDAKNYPALRNFYQIVRTGDEEQIILATGWSASQQLNGTSVCG